MLYEVITVDLDLLPVPDTEGVSEVEDFPGQAGVDTKEMPVCEEQVRVADPAG